MASRKVYLFEDRIEGIVNHSCTTNIPRLYPKVIVNTPKELRIALSDFDPDVLTSKKEKPGLLIFNFSKGITSCQVAGNTKYNDSGSKIIDAVISGSQMGSLDFSHKSVSFHNIDNEVYDFLKSLLKDEPKLTVSGNSTNLPTIVDSITISGPYNSHVTITYYSTKTLLMQGCVSTLFLSVFSDITSCISSDEVSLEGSFISLLQKPSKEWISSDLSEHFPDMSNFAGTVCKSLIETSISMLNSDIVVSDYSSMTHGIFRATEIIIGKRIAMVAPYSTRLNGFPDGIGRDFDNRVTPRVFKSTFTSFDGNLSLKRAIEDAYNHYCVHRHSTFHSDLIVPINTVIIDKKEDAIDLAKDSLILIRRILDNW